MTRFTSVRLVRPIFLLAVLALNVTHAPWVGASTCTRRAQMQKTLVALIHREAGISPPSSSAIVSERATIPPSTVPAAISRKNLSKSAWHWVSEYILAQKRGVQGEPYDLFHLGDLEAPPSRLKGLNPEALLRNTYGVVQGSHGGYRFEAPASREFPGMLHDEWLYLYPSGQTPPNTGNFKLTKVYVTIPIDQLREHGQQVFHFAGQTGAVQMKVNTSAERVGRRDRIVVYFTDPQSALGFAKGIDDFFGADGKKGSPPIFAASMTNGFTAVGVDHYMIQGNQRIGHTFGDRVSRLIQDAAWHCPEQNAACISLVFSRAGIDPETLLDRDLWPWVENGRVRDPELGVPEISRSRVSKSAVRGNGGYWISRDSGEIFQSDGRATAPGDLLSLHGHSEKVVGVRTLTQHGHRFFVYLTQPIGPNGVPLPGSPIYRLAGDFMGEQKSHGSAN